MERFTDFEFGVPWVMGLFHQDWMHEADTAAGMLKKHFAEESDQEILAVRRDAQALADHLDPEALEALWSAGAECLPANASNASAEWTRTIIALCDARLSEKADIEPLTGPDLEDGAGYEATIVAEIDRLGFFDPCVRQALTACARRCSPDLALRVLLTVLTNTPGAWLSQEQYARMEAIGSALHYGEFLVDRVAYLIEEGPPPSVPVRRFTDADFGVTWLMRAFRPAPSGSLPASPLHTLRRRLADESDPRATLALRRDAQYLLDYLPAHTSQTLWLAGTGLAPSFFSPDTPEATSGKAWMQTVIDACDARLAGLDVEPLSGADLADGGNRNRQRVDEIDTIARLLAPEVEQAIIDCAWLRSVDLAVRLMLRALAQAGTALSPHQYETLEQLGSGLLCYGECVVADIRYLVHES
ncbi:hypothetical protein [Streptomyces sp. 8L]|uniref:hypothetical protein n=1 Tax=Streptomyces sp. 8L TaxID=2877242 RepID=UPI001CD4FFDC|nr:hypothetical protein [Streptomyces sp. 8L]MCA1217218.1 hypothetical protein [Streptomyces sp. 8L]